MNRKKLLISLAMAMLSMAGLAADNLPALRVQGKNLVDANGKTVVLHGVMDTPNRYFNGWRWQQWKATYVERHYTLSQLFRQACLPPSLTRSRELIAPSSVCTWIHAGPTVIRLEGDKRGRYPAFQHETRYQDYSPANSMSPLVENAIAHGLYVIVRPPAYAHKTSGWEMNISAYLKKVWKLFASNDYHPEEFGQVSSIELANEPIESASC